MGEHSTPMPPPLPLHRIKLEFPVLFFSAPPFVYGDSKRRRRWSEPGKKPDEAQPEEAQPEDPVEESDGDGEAEVVDEKLDRNEAELRKISTGMCQVFLTEIAVERERRRYAKKRMIDPRSAARTPSANREPQYRLLERTA